MAENQAMENKLKALVKTNKPENRNKWALEAKKQGKKIMGMLCTYVPEEILSAAGIFPWRITGTWREAAPLAAAHRPEMTCRYCSHVLESVLTGELDFLDGVATTQVDDDFKRLWDVMHYIQKPPFTYIMYLPHTFSKTTFRMWNKSVADLKKAIEEWTGKSIKEQDLSQQIQVYNQMRDLLLKVYTLRKKETPALTGAEALGITTAARVMAKEEFNRELEALLPYLEKRKAPLKRMHPRLLMRVNESGDPWVSLADRYMTKPGTARMANWNEQADQMVQWMKEFDTKGVVELRQLYSLPLDYRFFVIKKRFEKANIPYISLSREYHLANVGMLRTRVEAFIEMIQEKV